MLRDICQSHVLVPPDATLLRLELADQKLNGSGLASPIGTNNSHAGSHANSQSDVFNGVLLVRRVLESDVLHLQDSAATRLDTLKISWNRENPFFVLIRKLEVRF